MYITDEKDHYISELRIALHEALKEVEYQNSLIDLITEAALEAEKRRENE